MHSTRADDDRRQQQARARRPEPTAEYLYEGLKPFAPPRADNFINSRNLNHPCASG